MRERRVEGREKGKERRGRREEEGEGREDGKEG